MSTATVEKQIGDYLSLLTNSQKKAVLTVVKTIATAHEEYENIWQDKAFAKEMDSRSKEYESGKTTLLKFDDVKTAAIAAYKAKKIRKK